MNVYIKAEIAAGTSIEVAALETLELADKFEVPVSFSFNGIELMARPSKYDFIETRVTALVEEYGRRLSFKTTEGRFEAARNRAG